MGRTREIKQEVIPLTLTIEVVRIVFLTTTYLISIIFSKVMSTKATDLEEVASLVLVSAS